MNLLIDGLDDGLRVLIAQLRKILGQPIFTKLFVGIRTHRFGDAIAEEKHGITGS